MGAKRTARAYLAATLLIAVSMLAAACSSTSTPAGTTVRNPKAAKPAGSWPYPNGDLANTRDAAGSAISSANVGRLQQAWTFKLSASLVTSGPGFGSLTATPIVTNGVVYLQDLGNNVYALDLAIGNPYQTAASAIAHPSPQLYTDSEVNLDAATGKLRWYYQGVTDDFMDHDMQTSPMAATISGEPAVIGSGKMGVVYAMDASTGRLIWKTPVGEHSSSDNYSVEAMEHKVTLTAPYTILPGGLGGGPNLYGRKGGSPQLVAYTVR